MEAPALLQTSYLSGPSLVGSYPPVGTEGQAFLQSSRPLPILFVSRGWQSATNGGGGFCLASD